MNSQTNLLAPRRKRLFGAFVALAFGCFSATPALADYFVDFEGAGETKTIYGSGNVSLSGIEWNMTEALIGGGEAAEFKIGARSARMRGYGISSMTMLADKPNGADTISFSHRRYGADTQVPWAVEYSSNSGGSWTQVGSDFTAGADVAVFSETVNVAGPIRFRIVSKGVGTTNRRMNIDDILITDFTGSDEIPPAIASLSPANGAVGVAANASLTATFNEAIAAGTGSVTLRAQSDGSAVQIFTIPGDVTISGSSLTVQPSPALALSTGYYVEIDPGAVKDLADNAFPGISGSGTWAFTTIAPDTVGPQVVSTTPTNGATNVSAETFLQVTFDEDASPGTGSILIKNAASSSVIAEIPVTGDAVLLFDNLLSVTLPSPLPPNTTFQVEFPAGLFVDVLGNPSPAFGQGGEWTFSTAFAASLTVDGYSQDFAEFVSAATLPFGWSVTGSNTSHSAWHTSAAASIGTGVKFSVPDVSVFGYQHTGSTNEVRQILRLVNDTAEAITELTVAYRGRVSRDGEADINRDPFFTVTVAGEVVSGLTYSTTAGDNVLRSASLTGFNIAPGEVFSIVWITDGRAAGSPGTGGRKQIGISEVNVAIGAEKFPPSLTGVTVDFVTLTQASVEVSAEVTTDGGAPVTGRGFVFAATVANPAPEIGGSGTTQLADLDPAVGEMTGLLAGLAPFTQYSVRAYAQNVEGITYSPAATFITLAPAPALATTYLQPFNDFSGSIVNGTLPAGWSVASTGGINGFAGTWGPTTTSGGLLGNVSSPGVLGYQHTGSSETVIVSLSLVNDSGATLEELYVSYLGRVSRATQPRKPEWAVSLNGTVVPELAYSTADGLDALKSVHLTGLSIAAGETFTLTWVSSGDVGEAGARAQIGIANVRVSTEEFVAGDFASWAQANGIAGQPADGDFDGDGISNFMEYALGLDPTAADGSPGTFANGTLSFAKGADAVENGDVVYAIETSSTLAPDSWTVVTPTTNTATEISYLLPVGQGRLFARLVVSAAP